MKKHFFLLLCACLVALNGSSQGTTDIPQYEGMKLVWHDEFNGTGVPDSTRWTFEHGFVRNRELQWYQPQNARVIGGVLQIVGRHEQVMNPNYKQVSSNWKKNRATAEYTSACLESRERFTFRYGRLEVSARIPTAPGAWPAIWTLGNQAGWPACGEVDLMEFYRVPPADVNIHHQAEAQRTVPVLLANACWQGPDGRDAWNTGRFPFSRFTDRDPEWAQKFHVWRMDWTPDFIRLYLDNELLNEIPTTQSAPTTERGFNPFCNDRPGFGQYILLNLAIGACGGEPDNSAFPMVYEVDYVRVYQQK